MPLLMHIAFDNSERFSRRVSYFAYRGIRFKLIQNDHPRWSDVLLTIIPLHDAPAEQRAYAAAAEWLSALSWQNRSRVALQNAGGFGIREGTTLRQQRCRMFVFPQVPFTGHTKGYDLWMLPQIETEHQRIALTLFREALSSNKVWLSFLFYWQVMEVGRTHDPVGWINRVCYKTRKVQLEPRELAALALGGRRVGEYLLEECRHAIAHVRREPGRRPLRFDLAEENRRMSVSTDVAGRLARHFIINELHLSKQSYLARHHGRGFPTYVAEQHLPPGAVIAYRGAQQGSKRRLTKR